MKIVFLAVCVLHLVNGYPGNGGYLYMADNGGHQAIPVQVMQGHGSPQQKFYIVPYSRLKSASDSDGTQSDDSDSDDDSGDSGHSGHPPIYSGGGHGRCPYAKHYGENDDSYDDLQDSPQQIDSNANKPKVSHRLGGYIMDYVENTDGYSD